MKSGNPQLRSNCTDCSEFFRWAVGCSSSRDSQSFGHATETGFFSGYTYLPVSHLKSNDGQKIVPGNQPPEMATGENAIAAHIGFRCGYARAPHFVNRKSGRPLSP